jgi:hypothetical protein
VKWMYLAIDALLADASGDQLRVLLAKVEYQDKFVLQRKAAPINV